MEHILAIDVGSGTQDILIYDPSKEMENNVKLILPSQTQIISREINEAAADGKDIFLHGKVMGGGASTKAVKEHLHKGLKVYSTKEAAYTFKDNLDRVKEQGIIITEDPPKDALPIELKDVDTENLSKALAHFGLDVPANYAIALQDHGYSPDESNRRFRFRHWEKFLDDGGDILNLVYENEIPDYFTRMLAVKNYLGQGAFMDTGSAAILGALEDEKVEKKYNERGCLLVNVGNQHTIAFLIHRGKVYGVFEHHTGALSAETLYGYLEKFKKAELTNEQVFDEKGHGCKILEEAKEFSWDFTAVTGPKRNMAADFGYLAVPHGDMMLSGCYGLVRGVLLARGEKK
ncbi:DUF1786 domain-containing protein [Natranaerofaba carboxydovora]|uniref:DUF1786 domain-containing protein n=1 Tax=Natranaerofaba carboxydovora TaxID=2742683 RepID=UPI001F12C9C7|nr:DUF1786 domain-containing protein [Natranaerofaba carboxydovora]UMZ73063.1 hypothetical protein ACONDI_00609 [Natranaerofaba carboxydovora]